MIIESYSKAVSYTHLDVYKRQGIWKRHKQIIEKRKWEILNSNDDEKGSNK